MSKEVFDWEKDPDLTTDTNILEMPLSSNKKGDLAIDALIKGYEYSARGLLTKEVTLEVSPEKEEEPIYYSERDIKIDEEGRKFFNDQYKMTHYLDDFGNLYYLAISGDTGEVREYTHTDSGILFFLDKTHTIAVSPEGWTYRYDPETREFEYDPNIIPITPGR